ncbi:hypothetical protein [Streptomyces nymphaeiformis]|uniref:Uncharacterized protein n=1 Tax=Streptomyces nymphaeiformis TaxID=2663842 RepID=A0A7W7U4A8_9ACTN|nr:hypothetical protein [Streptomyces nymphaeiformis]MBB4984787.1 hypothetical protein [Streptomyces nymphaeiformis]
MPIPPPDGELGHWFTPAASSLAGPLQVLEAGLRTERPGPWFGREAAHLLSGLRAAEPARLPAPTRHALAELADALGEADRAPHHSARLASERLTGLRRIEPIALTRRLDSDFVLRASSGERRPGRTEFLEQWPVAVGLTVTGGGLLEIEMEIEDHPVPPSRRLTDGALCHPVTVRPGTDTDTAGSGPGMRYWMVLDTSEGTLHGFVAVPAPDATFEVDLDAPPVPLRFLDRVSREELEASLPANERVTLSQWHRLIDDLPPHHPAHAALTTVNAPQRPARAAASANAFLEIQTAARQHREIDLDHWASEEARQALTALTARRDEQNAKAEVPGRRAYRKAQANLRAGTQTYAVDGDA